MAERIQCKCRMKMSQWYVQFKIWTHFFVQKKSKIIFILLFCSVLWFSFISLNGENSNATANVNLMLLYIWNYWKMLCACGYFANETIELNFVMHCTVPSVTVKCCYHFKDSFLMEMSSKLFFYFYSIENWIKQWNIFHRHSCGATKRTLFRFEYWFLSKRCSWTEANRFNEINSKHNVHAYIYYTLYIYLPLCSIRFLSRFLRKKPSLDEPQTKHATNLLKSKSNKLL